MKTQKTLVFLFSVLLTFFSDVASAQFYGNLNGGRDTNNQAIAVGIERTNSENKIVDNSLLTLNGSIAQNIKWIMINISKNNYIEQLVLPVKNGIYETRISLQDGAGFYDIQLYSSSAFEKNGVSYTKFSSLSVENTDSRDMSFLLPTLKVQADDQRIKNLVSNLTMNAQDDEEAFRAIYKYVTSKIKYDHASVNDGSYINKDYNAINALISSVAVCEGYANLLAAMSRAYGIRTKVIYGQGIVNSRPVAHGWNEVFINDRWEVADATWDAAIKKQPYLFMSPEKFAKDHIKETEMKY